MSPSKSGPQAVVNSRVEEAAGEVLRRVASPARRRRDDPVVQILVLVATALLSAGGGSWFSGFVSAPEDIAALRKDVAELHETDQRILREIEGLREVIEARVPTSRPARADR